MRSSPDERPSGSDRRREVRNATSGDVVLRQHGLFAGSFVGRVVDIAASGFRARHDHLNLTSGQVVDFELTSRSGQACTMWTRIVDGEAETGFRILPAGGV